jgi:uncharacterized GH25 family protein
VLLVMLSALGLAGCGNQPGVLEGTVTEVQTGQPVAQAQVLVYALEGVDEITQMDVYQKGDVIEKQTTDENGAFSISLAPGRYVVSIGVEGLEVENRLVEIKSGRKTLTDLGVTLP